MTDFPETVSAVILKEKFGESRVHITQLPKERESTRTLQLQEPKTRRNPTRNIHKINISREQTRIRAPKRKRPTRLIIRFRTRIGRRRSRHARKPEREFGRGELVVLREGLPEGCCARGGERLEGEPEDAGCAALEQA